MSKTSATASAEPFPDTEAHLRRRALPYLRYAPRNLRGNLSHLRRATSPYLRRDDAHPRSADAHPRSADAQLGGASVGL